MYDHGAIAEHVDAIRIMAYDFSVAEPGPIAPLAWVQRRGRRHLDTRCPPEYHDKLVLGVPSYGTNWAVSTVGECPSTAEGRTERDCPNGGASWRPAAAAYRRIDAATGEWSFAYSLTVDDGTISCVQNRKVHWVDAEGAAARVEIARRAGWGGVALWALGYEDDEVWQAIVTASRTPLTATTTE